MITFLPIDPPPEPWDETELSLLRELVPLTDLQISKVLGRSADAIKKKRQELGLLKKRGRPLKHVEFPNPEISSAVSSKITGAFIKRAGIDFSGSRV